MSWILFLAVVTVTFVKSPKAIKSPDIHSWTNIDVYNDKRIQIREVISQKVASVQECLRLCWRMTSCQAVTYSPLTLASCSVVSNFRPTSSQLVDDVTSVVVDMRRASLDKDRLYGCDKRPCSNTEMCVSVRHKSDHLCLPVGRQPCGVPPRMSHALVTQDGFGTAFYSCLLDYLPTSPDSMTSWCHMTNGSWSRVDGTCSMLNCGRPPVVEGATVQMTSTTATYTCQPGHQTQGHLSTVVTCQVDGNWTRGPGPCAPLDCGQPTPVSHGVVSFGGSQVDNRTKYQSLVYHSCATGYVSATVSITSVCQENGQWSTVANLECTPVDCGPPTPERMAAMNYNTTTYLAVIHYQCLPGYYNSDPTQPTTSVCQPDGSWTPMRIMCVPRDCLRPVVSLDVSLSYNYTTFGSKAEISCMRVDEAWEGSKVIECEASGRWSPALGHCVGISCGPAPSLANADVTLSKLLTVDGIGASYTCHTGYRFNNTDNRRELNCLSAMMSWAGDLHVTCQTVNCGTPPEVANADVTTINGVEYRAQATYTCIAGHVLATRESVRTCTETGQWSRETINCREYTCDAVPEVPNADIDPYGKSDFKIGESLTYVCQPNFVLSTSANVITCQASGWERSSVQCLSVPCGDPPLVEHSTREVRLDISTSVYAARYECEQGYTLENARVFEMTCVGYVAHTWTNEAVRCLPSGCGPPPGLANANVTFTSTSVSSQAIYRCHQGFRLTAMSANTRTCNVDQTWSNEQIICEEIDCNEPPIFPNSQRTFASTTFGSTVSYICLPGFRSLDAPALMASCTENGTWTGNAFSLSFGCRHIICANPPDVAGAELQITNPQDYLVGDTVTYECLANFTFSPSSSSAKVCNGSGMWDGLVECLQQTCREPELPNARFVSIEKHIRGMAVYECEAGHQMVNGRQQNAISCQENFTWTTALSPCIPIICLEPPEVENAVASFNSTVYNSAVVYSCYANFEMITNFNWRRCQETGEWSDEFIECKPIGGVSCPEPPTVDNASFHYLSRRPEAVAFYECDMGFEHWWFERRFCTSHGDWTNQNITCKPVDCGLAPNVSFALYTSNGTTLGSTILYECLEDYEFKTAFASRSCLPNGFWTDDHIECGRRAEASCPLLTGQPYADVRVQSVLSRGLAFARCKPGFQMSPLVQIEQSFTCNAGTWIGNPIDCLPRDCGPPPSVLESSYGNTSTVFGSTVEYVCKPGKSISGPSQRSCQVDGTWSSEVIECLPNDISPCPQPPEFSATTLTYSSHTIGSVATYTCKEGFTGQGEYLCSTKSVWVPIKSVTCDAIDCKEPPTLPNADRHYHATRYGSIAVYTCILHPFVLRPSRSKCLANGIWSFVPNLCQGCLAPPPAVDNASLVDISFEIGGRATYSCLANLTANVSPMEKRCMNDGQWSGENFRCDRPSVCHTPPALEKTELNATYIQDNIKYAIYTCMKGYYFSQGTGTLGALECHQDTGWNNTVLKCLPVDCGPPPLFADTFNTATGNWSAVTIVCPVCDVNAVVDRGRLVSITQDKDGIEAAVECNNSSQLFLLHDRTENVVQCIMDFDFQVHWDDLMEYHCLQMVWESPAVPFTADVIIPDDAIFFEACLLGLPFGRFRIKLLASSPASPGKDAQAISIFFKTQSSVVLMTQVDYDGDDKGWQTFKSPVVKNIMSDICVLFDKDTLTFRLLADRQEVGSYNEWPFDHSAIHSLAISGDISLTFFYLHVESPIMNTQTQTHLIPASGVPDGRNT